MTRVGKTHPSTRKEGRGRETHGGHSDVQGRSEEDMPSRETKQAERGGKEGNSGEWVTGRRQGEPVWSC